jgi:hypothetical protein
MLLWFNDIPLDRLRGLPVDLNGQIGFKLQE